LIASTGMLTNATCDFAQPFHQEMVLPKQDESMNKFI